MIGKTLLAVSLPVVDRIFCTDRYATRIANIFFSVSVFLFPKTYTFGGFWRKKTWPGIIIIHLYIYNLYGVCSNSVILAIGGESEITNANAAI